MNNIKYKLCNECYCDHKICKECCHNHKICRECCCGHKTCNVCCCKKESFQNACVDIMKSIANIETALSRILNQEGEKIYKVLETTDDIEDILRVNREVNKTIVNITHLEHVVYAKLSALIESGICCDMCHEKTDND